MIVLTKEQKNLFLDTKKKYREKLLQNNVDFIPIEIKGGFWVLPEEVLKDERFLDLKSELYDFGKLGILREVKKDEFIVNEI